ncbi:inositol monophosphatase family protein [Occultella gossypii]|uniref:Inositol monophosphatase n=1 Tax=Occultella gossypii TaxID=2800820 RepID=A0ABS7S558_9MICO|nr:inositol monophosphatase family protein [Occultella gossypii]MBZ2195486.1 inositol monophosphatase [Occultella gossypii]
MSGSPRLVAHRGLHAEADGGARENTLAAVAAAIGAGLTWIEIDVRVTRDGAVVLLHDATLERLWSDPRAITDVTLDEVVELGGGDRRIPLLSDALRALHGTGCTLLIDIDDPDVAGPAARVVAETPTDAGIAWCGDPQAMARIKEQHPAAAIWTAWYSPEPPAAEDLDGVSVVNAQHLLVGAAFVDAVHTHGVEVAVWTVDDPAQAAHLAALGVDSITTNRALTVRAGTEADAVDQRARQTAIALELAEQAAEMTAHARRDGIQTVETKTGPADHVTEVDRGIERWVQAVLRAQFPEHDVVGEEYGGSANGTRPCWYLDPVDGTANLANGFPWTSFSLALVEHGRPVVGVVFDPVGGTVDGVAAPVPVLAVEGRGTWRAGRRLTTTPTDGADPLSGALVITELNGARTWPGMHDLIDALGERDCTVRIPGSGTATLSGIAMGRGVAAIIHRYSPLDHAAAALVVLEAGGTVLDDDGNPNPHPVGSAIIAGADERAAKALWAQWQACPSS